VMSMQSSSTAPEPLFEIPRTDRLRGGDQSRRLRIQTHHR
jgi:hypothetical protein